jgi:hypothetical protein
MVVLRVIGALLVSWPARAAAQVSAAKTITATEIARHVRVMADDSMLGRDTPSGGLERPL